eukprot:TRINITY_DN9767_c0_g1_i1.p1 TRINITY_DN9767_c0_g1~~TRINITY_DN9767_c0_g1_i1.p1  ORF type:complete len:790 (-),score=101.72 TRINITY_DN9767_c0_g1_i1:184-2553(-)
MVSSAHLATSPVAASLTASGEGIIGPGPLPDWMTDGQLNVCQVFHDASSQIVANCKHLGRQLEGVCSHATQRMPGVDTPECLGFLAAFELFSQTLQQLAGDLELTVTAPLQKAITTFNEESVGRVKHWRQVRMRLIELQERYRKHKLRSLEARKGLASAENAWFRKKSQTKAAEQHAAMCDLARCEEELRESEATLRTLEEDSRERLRQLDSEKNVLLKGVLTKGRGFLQRLSHVVDKAIPGAGLRSPSPEPELSRPKVLNGVMPETGDACRCDGAAEVDNDEIEEFDDDAMKEDTAATTGGDTLHFNTLPSDGAKESSASASHAYSKYLHGVGQSTSASEAEFNELAELGAVGVDDHEDALSRVNSWSPALSGGGQRSSRGRPRRSLVFGTDSPLTLKGSTDRDPAYASTPSKNSHSAHSPSGHCDSLANSAGSLLHNVAAVAALAVEASTPSPSTALRPQVCNSVNRPSTCGEVPSISSTSRPARVPSNHSVSALGLQKKCSSENDADTPSKFGQTQPRARAPDDEDSEDDDIPSSPVNTTPSFVNLEVCPLVSDDARGYFERYVRRLPERLAFALETSWSSLQSRASEQLLGGMVGKLNFFWIVRCGSKGSPEDALGLVCFQFCQGLASNHARILHMSVVGDNGDADVWNSTFPSAIVVVRKLIFGTLPVSSIRSVILAGEDDDGLIYIDSDLEKSYKSCQFRWFQLTQKVKHTKSVLTGRASVRLKSRFLVLHATRAPDDPIAPDQKHLSPLPALLLHNDDCDGGTENVETAGVQESVIESFSSW